MEFDATDNKILKLKSNSIIWYDFKNNSNVLIVGQDTNELEEFLKGKACKLRKVNKESFNEDISTKYNYIILNDCFSYKDSDENNIIFLKKIYEMLSKDGIILILNFNLLSMKFLAEADYENNELIGISINSIENYLRILKLDKNKIYYPVPSHKNANIIFSDNLLPDSIMLNRNIDLLKKVKYKNFNDRNILSELVSNNQNEFKKYCTSFLIDIRKSGENDVNAIFYNNLRKEKYKLITKIMNDEVRKCEMYESAKEHLNKVKVNIDIMNKIGINTLDSYDEIIHSCYEKNTNTLEQEILLNYDKGDFNNIDKLINNYKEKILYKLHKIESTDEIFRKYKINISKEKIQKLNFVKYGLFDLIFQNIFIKDNDFFVYDQEWIEYNLPIEYILFRCFLYLPTLDGEQRDRLYRDYNLKEYENEFMELEKAIIKDIMDDDLSRCNYNNLTSYKDRTTNIQEIINQKENEYLKIIDKNNMCLKKIENDLNKTINEKKDILKELNLKNNLYTTMISEKDKTIEEKENRIKNLENSIKSYVAQVKEQNIVIENKESKIEDINKKIDLYMNTIKYKENVIIDNENQIKSLEENVLYYENLKIVKLHFFIKKIKNFLKNMFKRK